VHDRAAMRRIMRYNDWQHDPYSDGDPEKAIASRADLKGDIEGNIDAKLVGLADVKAMRFEGISGPTHETQKVFSWATANMTEPCPHWGQPESFPFGWTTLFG